MLTKSETVRTTVSVPGDLIDRAQHFVGDGALPNRNALIVAALEHFVTELERREIDRQFEMMVDDHTYRSINQELTEDFAESDWEALNTEQA